MILGVHPLLQSLAPELVLVVGAALVMLIGLSTRRKVADSAFSIALSTMAIAAYAAYRLQQSPAPDVATLLGDSLVSL